MSPSETLLLNPQHLLAHVLESQVGVDVVRGRDVCMPHDVLEPRRAHAVPRHAGGEAIWLPDTSASDSLCLFI